MTESRDILTKNEEPGLSNGVPELTEQLLKSALEVVAEQLVEVGHFAIEEVSVSADVLAMLTCPMAIGLFGMGIVVGCIISWIFAWTGRLPLLEKGVTEAQQVVLRNSITLSNVLQCPVCLEIPESRPIFQCRSNGHVVCQVCLPYLEETCPVCRARTGFTRCRVAENLLEELNPLQTQSDEVSENVVRLEFTKILVQMSEEIEIILWVHRNIGDRETESWIIRLTTTANVESLVVTDQLQMDFEKLLRKNLPLINLLGTTDRQNEALSGLQNLGYPHKVFGLVLLSFHLFAIVEEKALSDWFLKENQLTVVEILDTEVRTFFSNVFGIPTTMQAARVLKL